MGEQYDSEVLRWKSDILSDMQGSQVLAYNIYNAMLELMKGSWFRGRD